MAEWRVLFLRRLHHSAISQKNMTGPGFLPLASVAACRWPVQRAGRQAHWGSRLMATTLWAVRAATKLWHGLAQWGLAIQEGGNFQAWSIFAPFSLFLHNKPKTTTQILASLPQTHAAGDSECVSRSTISPCLKPSSRAPHLRGCHDAMMT